MLTTIIGKMKSSKHWERTHKYGVRVPRNIKEALAIDAENRNTLWADAVGLERRATGLRLKNTMAILMS